MRVRLDDRDKKILKILQSRGRITKAALAERINLSASACWERVRRLERLKIIESYRAIDRKEEVEGSSPFIVQVELENHRLADFEAFEAVFRQFDEIIECVAIGGGADYFIRVQASSVESYQKVIDQLLATAFRTFNIIDEFSRECLAIRLKRKLNSVDVIDVLTDLFILRGEPAFIRSDNGPEFVAQAVRDWIAAVGAGQPTSNLAHPGKTATARASTGGSGTSCSTARSSTASKRHRS